MTAAQPSATTAQDPLRAEDVGYHKSLRPRQLQMIGIGGAIGTGLFLGARSRLAGAGPGLFLVYAVCGVFVFFILQALGELVLYHPSSGSSVSYAREFYEKKLAVVVGWMFFFHWSTTAIADITAIASYVQYWRAFRSLPQWLFALIALVAVVGINLISVRWFGELEFWAALIKVVALVTFLIVGTIFLACRFEIYGQSACPSVIADHGGLFPIGVLPLVLVTTGVVFAYAGVELAGIAARRGGEPGQDHVARDQLCDRPDRGVLRRLTCSARTAAAALHRVPCGGESLRETWYWRRGFDPESGCSDRGVLQPQWWFVLDRPDSAFDVDERKRARDRLADVVEGCAVYRHLGHCGGRADRRRSQWGGAGQGVGLILAPALAGGWFIARRRSPLWRIASMIAIGQHAEASFSCFFR
ncbi:hypothetical protein IFM12275_23720 [Nocardia sputorum]|nr:hypothetical protein IFM12275_23720 [Nocardia sputorum]